MKTDFTFEWITFVIWTLLIRLGDALGNQTLTKSDVANITRVLDQLLDGYDKRLRPGFGGPPTDVAIWMNIRSMGPVSEIDMMYSMDCYLRHTWRDSRLQFAGKLNTLQLNYAMLKQIWKPDTYIVNGMGSYLHTVTGPNILLRIDQAGQITYSMRLTIKARCPMHLEKFPMDSQKCPMRLASFGYTTKELVYRWKNGNSHSIKWSQCLRLSQFDLTETPAGNGTLTIKDTVYSSLFVHFSLERHMGYFLIQVYVPCTLLVILSWVSFWINREATADRIALGVMSVLTMAFLGIDNRANLPKVSYSTAIDWYLGTCFAFVLATILQFSGVHYFTKHGSGEINIMLLDQYEEEEAEAERQRARIYYNHYNECEDLAGDRRSALCDDVVYKNNGRPARSNGDVRTHVSVVSYVTDPHDDEADSYENFFTRFWNCIKGSAEYRDMKTRTSRRGVNSVSQIDRIARVLFPLVFILFSIIYWTLYLKIL